MGKSWMVALAIGVAAPAGAQLLGGGSGLGSGGLGNSGLGGVVGGVTGELLGQGGGAGGVVGGLQGPLMAADGTLRTLTSGGLLSARRDRLRALVRDNRATIDVDDDGNLVRRDEIIGLGLSDDALAKAKTAGFAVKSREALDDIGITVTTLAPPKGKSARKAMAQLRASDPGGSYTLDHIYEPARAPLAQADGAVENGGSAGGATLGLIDGGVAGHPAFAHARIEQRGFAGDPKPSGHGTAVASLMVGEAGAFHGVAPNSPLLVADVYGGSAGNGSAVAIARAMAWMAQRHVRVVNISLVGPPNPLLAAGVKALQGKGIIVVAAVGNDGPAAPPQYPASYAGVVSVTGVDSKGRTLIEAGKPLHLDYAAPGADMVGAVPGKGWEMLRGTSFAAPLVAARIARVGSVAALASETKPGNGRVGRGIVCGSCATPPKNVGLK